MFFLSLLFILILAVLAGVYYGRMFGKRLDVSDYAAQIEQSIQFTKEKADAQYDLIISEAKIAAKEKSQFSEDHFNEKYLLEKKIIDNAELELNGKQSEIDKRLSGFHKIEEKIQELQRETENISSKTLETLNQRNEILQDFDKKIEERCNSDKQALIQEAVPEIIRLEKLDVGKWAQQHGEQLKHEAGRRARSILENINSHYQPGFLWPKIPFVVNVSQPQIIDKHFQEDSELIALLLRDTDVTLSALTVDEAPSSLLKISGGLGVDKEAIRLTLEDMVNRNSFQLQKAENLLQKNRTNLDKKITQMARAACQQLHLKKEPHAEILKLIGSLNYRTSHRQNQYFHSLEVAILSGLIASELNLDTECAKRSGLMHDIGKVLDYKIQGSHAVISGDYAQKYEEHPDVVDNILAHHDDKIVETPLAYVIKAADALSGARPGARVDMEEGYTRRIDGISGVVSSFSDQGVTGSAIMSAGREIHVYVDSRKVKDKDILPMADAIAKKLEGEVEFPGQIRVTVIRRTEVTAAA